MEPDFPLHAKVGAPHTLERDVQGVEALPRGHHKRTALSRRRFQARAQRLAIAQGRGR